MADQAQKGILTSEQEEKIAKMVDDLIVAKNPIVEAVDGIGIKAALRFLDNVIIDKMEDSKKALVAEYLGEMIDAL